MMKKIFLLLTFAALLTAEVSAQIPYTIRFKTNAGATTGGNSFLSTTAAGALTQVAAATTVTTTPATSVTTVANNQWYFIPVGDEITDNLPGWYYIRNVATGGYLRAANNSNNNITITPNRGTDNNYMWRLVKTTANNTGTGAPATAVNARSFKLVPKNSNMVMVRTGNDANIRVDTAYSIANSTVQIALADENVVFNEDMELISNHEPYNGNSALNATNWAGVLNLPDTIAPDFLWVPPVVAPPEPPEEPVEPAEPAEPEPTPSAIPGITVNSIFSPVGYHASSTPSPEDYAGEEAARVGPVRLIHDHEASGSNPGDGYYFARLYQNAVLDIPLTNQASTTASDLLVGFWVRAQRPDSIGTNNLTYQDTTYIEEGDTTTVRLYKVGEIQIGESAYHIYPIWVELIDEANSPIDDQDAWIYYEFEIAKERFNTTLGGVVLPQNSTVHIKNNLLGIGSLLDVDNLAIEINTNDLRTFLYHNSPGAGYIGTPQPVHELTQVVYLRPNNSTPLTAASQDYTYYRWHVKEHMHSSIMRTTTTPAANTVLNTRGKFHWNVAGFGDGTSTNGRQSNVRAPRNLNAFDPEDPLVITCDAANYNNWDVSATNTLAGIFKEPTLSYRHNFEIRPAWEIAKAINDSLAHDTIYEIVKLTAPTGGAATTGNYYTAGGTNTRLRLSPKFDDPQNYFYLSTPNRTTPSPSGDLEFTAEEIYGGTVPGLTLLRGTQFLWVKSTNQRAASNPTLTLGGTAALLTLTGVSDVTLITSGGTAANPTQPGNPYYFPLGNVTTKPYLQINTAGKKVGDTEYYDVYVMDDAAVASRIVKKIARFEVNYVPRGAASDTYTGDAVAPDEGKAPRLSAYGPVSQPTDLLAAVTNKKLIAELNFDQLGDKSLYGFGKTPLKQEESSYGFVDPTLYEGDGITATGRGAHGRTENTYINAYGYYGEYSFPRAVRGGITGPLPPPAPNPDNRFYFDWWYGAHNRQETASVYDRTFWNTGGNPASLTASPLDANNPDFKIGNMMFVDASQIRGTVASLKINEAMCPGTELFFSAYIVNLNTPSATTTEGQAADTDSRPNLIFVLKDKTSGSEVTRFYTGDIGRNAAGAWFQIAFSFQIPNEYLDDEGKVNFVLEVINNGLNSAGNDFAIDDIKIYRSNPSVWAIRTNEIFCKPDGTNEQNLPLNMKVDIDMSQLTAISKDNPDSHTLYFRFLDGEGVTFPDKAEGIDQLPYTTSEDDIYIGEGVYSNGTDYYSYGTIDLTKFEGTFNSTNGINDTLYYTLSGVTYDEIMLTEDNHLIFMQTIPPKVLDAGGGMGTYSIYVAEASQSLLMPTCSGEAKFEVRHDTPDFSANVEGTTNFTNPDNLVVCTNRLAEINATSKDAITGDNIITSYDWYFGPINTHVTEDEDELAEIEYDGDLNHIGYNQRCFVGTIVGDEYVITECEDTPQPPTAEAVADSISHFEALEDGSTTYPNKPIYTDFVLNGNPVSPYDNVELAIAAYDSLLVVYNAARTKYIFADYNAAVDIYDHEDVPPGHYMVKDDLIALRHFYQYATTDRPRKTTEIDLITHFPVSGQTDFGEKDKTGIDTITSTLYIPNVDSLKHLLLRVRQYVKAGILTLHQQKVPVAFGSLAPYFYTVVPINIGTKAGATEDDRIPVQICTTPSELRIKASNWGPEVEFGKVNDRGLPDKVYRNITHPDYIYTIRIPQKDANGNETTQFVVPMLYFDEARMVKVELVEVNGDSIAASGAVFGISDGLEDNIPGYKLDGVHLGVIDPANPKYELDQNDRVTITRIYDMDGGYTELGGEEYLTTYWGLDEIDRSNPRRAMESYPLLYSAYHYYNPDADVNHTLFDEGHPYPLGTDLTAGAGLHTSADTLKNNSIGLEIKASSLPASYRNGTSYFKPGYEYVFRFMCTAEDRWINSDVDVCDKGYYFRLKVVPDTVYWDGTGTNESWHNDTNWKTTDASMAFAPLKETNVVLPAGATHYPILSNDSIITAVVTIDESTTLNPNAKETRFIEYDCNFEPNVVSTIHFQSGAELGNQYYLTYDSARVDLEVIPMTWYGLSAPLRQMYSGDYMFERANPLTEMKLYNTVNPQTHQTTLLDWTKSFNTTTQLLSAGLGYNLRVGSVYYGEFDDEGDGRAVPGSKQNLGATPQKFSFPQHKMSFQLYNEINKKPIAGKIETIPQGGRDFGGRFIYETTKDGKSVVPSNDTLAILPTNVTQKNQSIVVGNPFMSHIDFAKFYKANSGVITPGFQVFNGTSYLAVSALSYEDSDGEIGEFISADDGLTLTSIAPMQTFLVTTKEGYNGTPSNLVITKEMSYVAPPSSISSTLSTEMRSRSKAAPSVLRIKASRDSLTTYAAVALSERASNGYILGEDSRRVSVSNVANVPNIFTITDGMYLDINRLHEMPEALPIGITTTGLGNTTITISGLDILDDARGYYFKDTQATPQLISLAGENEFAYTFNNTGGDQIGRFYIVYEQSTEIDDKHITRGNIQIYAHQGLVHILTSDGTNLDGVEICSVDGQKIYQQTNIGSSHISVPMHQLPNPVLIVRVSTAKTTQISKIVVTR